MNATFANDARRSHTTIYILIALAVFICFGNLVRAEFTLWDDLFNIAQNPHMNPPTFTSIWWYWHTPAYGLYIPVTYTVWGLLAAVAYLPTPDEFGTYLNPAIFHGASVIFHLISAIAAYHIIERIVRHRFAAFAGALLFALHPVQVESVGWAAGLKDVLCGMFSLLAVWAYLTAVDPERTNLDRRQRGAVSARNRFAHPRHAVKTDGDGDACNRLRARLVDSARPLKSVLRSLWPWMVLSISCAMVARMVQLALGIVRCRCGLGH